MGDEVMITVIATGFDANKRRDAGRREAPAHHDAPVTTSLRGQPRERDFLEELERQRVQTNDDVRRPVERPRPDERQSGRRQRSVGEAMAPRRRRPTTRTTSRSRASSAASEARRLGRRSSA